MMPRTASLPFFVRRNRDVVMPGQVTSTREKMFGLLFLKGNALRIQWRASRRISRAGRQTA